jgi:hypothetical protein
MLSSIGDIDFINYYKTLCESTLFYGNRLRGIVSMKILVTGSTGFIGNAIAIDLIRRGEEVFDLI